MDVFIELVHKLQKDIEEEELSVILNTLDGIIYPLDGLQKEVINFFSLVAKGQSVI